MEHWRESILMRHKTEIPHILSDWDLCSQSQMHAAEEVCVYACMPKEEL